MAGSYEHCARVDHPDLEHESTDLEVYSSEEFSFDLIDNMRDAYQACEHMFAMIRILSDGNAMRIKDASDRYHARLRGEG